MRNRCVQMSLYDIYNGVSQSVEEHKPELIQLLEKHLVPYKGVYSLLPDISETNPDAKQQHINGHFCYAMKLGIVTNGLGIPRHIEFFDDDFKARYPETVVKKSDSPDVDKEIGDSTSLKPVLTDFFNAHPNMSFKTFIADSAFDSYDNYSIMKCMTRRQSASAFCL